MTTFRTAYETCPMCRGYIMHFNAYGEVEDGCNFCAHMGRIRIRDDKGRFTTREITNPPGTLPPLPMPMPGNPEAGSTPGTAAPASELGVMARREFSEWRRKTRRRNAAAQRHAADFRAGRYGCCQSMPPQADGRGEVDTRPHRALADGGENRERNIQILCAPCSTLKTSGEAY
jgi:hypothetical protein